jgi:ring-1,2-phenylacetyl-CoA epoxidase subunit PaaC
MSDSTIQYTLYLADNSLIFAQRNSEWCGHGPVLEQDIAITNITLDLIGQARNFYQYAAHLINELPKPEKAKAPSPPGEGVGVRRLMSDSDRSVGGEVTEDTLAYLRTEREFKNCLLVEQPNGDWAQTILRQYLFSQFQYLVFQELQQSKDEQLAAIAAKALKEVAYHLRWSSEWVIRLGDGTEESHQRMLKAVDELWRYTGEFFIPAGYELQAAEKGIGADVSGLKDPWMNKVNEIFTEATLPVPQKVYMQSGGKEGIHTEHLGFILAEMQYLQRVYPGCEW